MCSLCGSFVTVLAIKFSFELLTVVYVIEFTPGTEAPNKVCGSYILIYFSDSLFLPVSMSSRISL